MPNMYGNTDEQNKNRLKLPANIAPVGAICIQIQIPNDVDYIATFWGVLGRLSSQQSWQRDENKTAKIVANQWHEIIESATLCVATKKASDKGNEITIEDCSDMRDLIINISGCGCVDSTTSTEGKASGGIGVSRGGGATQQITDIVQSLNSGSIVTVCDWVTGGGTAYILDQFKESLLFYKNLSTGGGVQWIAEFVDTLTAGFSEVATEWIRVISDTGFEPAIAMVDDAQFHRAYQQAWIAQSGGTGNAQPPITRDFLVAVGRRLGIADFSTGTITLPSLTAQALGQISNINDINLFRVGIQGTGNQAICQQLSQLANVPYVPPVLAAGAAPSEGVALGESYVATLIFEGDLRSLNGAQREIGANARYGALVYVFIATRRSLMGNCGGFIVGSLSDEECAFSVENRRHGTYMRANGQDANAATELFRISTDEAILQPVTWGGNFVDSALSLQTGSIKFSADGNPSDGLYLEQVWRIDYA